MNKAADAGHHITFPRRTICRRKFAPEALAFNGIDPNDPDRGAVTSTRRCTKFLKLYVKVLKRAL